MCNMLIGMIDNIVKIRKSGTGDEGFRCFYLLYYLLMKIMGD